MSWLTGSKSDVKLLDGISQRMLTWDDIERPLKALELALGRDDGARPIAEVLADAEAIEAWLTARRPA